MQSGLFKSYLKANYKAWIISFIILIALYTWIRQYALTCIFLVPINLLRGWVQYKRDLKEAEKLKKRGLTPEDVTNIAFVKSWEDSRQRGIFYYIFVQGGIFYGMAFCFLFCAINGFLDKDFIKHLQHSPAYMFRLIGKSYAEGALVSMLYFRIMWAINEKKFIRLTEPLH